jgi:hypothetical protein
MSVCLLLRQELALQNLLHLLRDVLGHGCQGGAQAAALVFERGMLAVEGLEGLQAFEGREVLVWEENWVLVNVSSLDCRGKENHDLLRLM